ncbi:hypothetical protein [Aeromicrobium alkaliterrae]|uniref:Leucine rich repeat variant n=1 Tax=Aeromicrobium alkaliterrae TaxID=302168 RepID=A0ABN2JXH4_9ACTN
MSCVSFWGPDARERMVAAMAAPPVATFASPGVSDGKLRRVALMATSPDPRVRESAALNAHVPVEVLESLAVDPEMSVRCCVARSPQASPEVLTWLARDESAPVRRWVGAHPVTPPEVMDSLAEDPDVGVREVVQWNRRWPTTPGG